MNWNGTLAPGGTASFGYQGTLSGAYSSPTSFSLNGGCLLPYLSTTSGGARS
ncbi:cellulose binding domain-containing protein [Micromonospora cremea]|uniref:cellulose binding domain-containing protein n=1 Tax=Micromonospora cremea TaxID=709881 RepID=UPI00313ACCDB